MTPSDAPYDPVAEAEEHARREARALAIADALGLRLLSSQREKMRAAIEDNDARSRGFRDWDSQ